MLLTHVCSPVGVDQPLGGNGCGVSTVVDDVGGVLGSRVGVVVVGDGLGSDCAGFDVGSPSTVTSGDGVGLGRPHRRLKNHHRRPAQCSCHRQSPQRRSAGRSPPRIRSGPPARCRGRPRSTPPAPAGPNAATPVWPSQSPASRRSRRSRRGVIRRRTVLFDAAPTRTWSCVRSM